MNAVAIVFIRLSSRASGWISRMRLADGCRHGAVVAPVSVALRDLVGQNINFMKCEPCCV